MTDRWGRWAEIVFALLAMAFAGAMLYDGRNLAANPFEPLGSKAIPGAAAGIAILLALIVLVSAACALRGCGPERPPGEQWGVVAVAFLLTVLYGAVLASGVVRYRWATLVFIPLVVLIVTDDRRQACRGHWALARAYGFGLDAIFRHVLVTDIP